MARRRSRINAIQRAVRAELEKAAADFNVNMVGPGGYPNNAAQLMQRYNKDFGAAGPLTAQFGPGVPPVETRLDDTGEPRQWQYRVGWNIPSLPGEGRPLGMDALRQLADTYDIARKCIEIRKDELTAMRFDVVALETDRKRARQIIQDQQDRIKEIKDFFSFPDRIHTWQGWLRMVLEDYFVLDAATIWKWRELGGKLRALRVLDGATVKPLLSVEGTRPEPPDPAYQQYLYGVARWSFDSNELIYAPKNQRANSVYGQSPIEQFILHINESLRFQRWTTDYFTDGTLPEGVAEAPATWTPKQLEEYNLYWDRLIAGDSRQLRKLHFVPNGFKWHQFKAFTFDIVFARWLVGVTAAAFDITPTELGFEPMHGGLGGKGFAEEQSKVLERKANGPLKRWLCDEILNPLIWTEFHAPDLQAVLLDPQEEAEGLTEAQSVDLDIRNGRRSIDQIVEEDGGEPPGIGRIFVFGPNTVLGEADLKTISTEGWSVFAEQLNAAAPKSPVPLGLLPEHAPDKPGASSGARQIAADQAAATTQAKKEETEQGQAQQAKPAAGKPAPSSTVKYVEPRVDEFNQFLRFVRKHDDKGTWRDFVFVDTPASVGSDLNKAAKAGASVDELRALVGLEKQPQQYRETVAHSATAYRGLTKKLATRMSELVEAHR